MQLLMQWHITGQCNLQCGHCYQEGPQESGPGMQEMREVLRQFTRLRLQLAQKTGNPVRLHINITGGEPMLHPDFWPLLSEIAGASQRSTFGVLSNGTLINKAAAGKFRKSGASFVQVSIDGAAATHDTIRGRGSYGLAVEGLKRLSADGVPAMISFTAHRDNYLEFPSVVRLGVRLGVCRVWADRLIPAGSGAHLRGGCLSPAETRSFIELMHRCRSKSCRVTEIGMHRALQFIAAGSRPYRCAAGGSLLTIMPDGTVYPCRRMPISVGNIFETPLAEIYAHNPLLKKLRAREPAIGCEKCFYSELCGGGLRCLSFAMHGDPFRADPGCWLAHTKENYDDYHACLAGSC